MKEAAKMILQCFKMGSKTRKTFKKKKDHYSNGLENLQDGKGSTNDQPQDH